MAEIVIFQELYSWQNDHDQSIFVDGPNGVLIYQNVYDKSVRVVESSGDHGAFNSTRFAKPLCESMSFSPDGRFILYWHNSPLSIGLTDISAIGAPDVVVDSSPYEETIVLNLFWVEPNSSSSADFVVVCTNCIDIYHFNYGNQSVRRVFSKRISCCEVWNDVSGTHIILLRNNQSLQPYHIHNKEAKLVTDIELSIRRDQKIQKSDICIATIYDEAYCIYKDVANGMISLRSISNSKTRDIVLEVRSQGWLDIIVIDNLLLTLTGGGDAYIFDIRMKDNPLLAKVPQRKPPISSISSDIQGKVGGTCNRKSRAAFIPNVIVDYYGGFAYRLVIDHSMLTLYLSRCYAEPLIVDFYQRRKASLQRVFEIITSSITNRMNKFGKTSGRNTAIPFHLVEEFIGEKSVVTEYRMANSILYSLVIKEWNVKSGENLFDVAIALMCHHLSFDYNRLLTIREDTDAPPGTATNFILKSRLTCGSKDNVSSDVRDYLALQDAEIPGLYCPAEKGTPYIVNVTLCYIKALMMHHLYPSHLIQIFLFDMCVLYNNISLLLLLIRSRVIRDSSYVCYRLMYLYVVLNDKAVRQQCRDMALRMKLYGVCVMIGILEKDYYQLLVFLKTQNVSSYPLHRILYRAANDVEKQAEQPHLWSLLLAFTRSWIEESNINPKECKPPNMCDCEMWLPNL
ncbi:hypothetical protein X943_001753 [Babesia divergens]|uniref:Mic1 domain-containing protein n=1 Tax=Babesia divergens TaxID=32595 RepID=A0AAD9GFG4_BABDI|nr:hypothetical protein X943_001753 [Babesia divergens]